MTLSIGTTFARRYEIVARIGEGKSSTVYLARDLETDQEVALKVLNAALRNPADVEKIGFFRREVEILKTLCHHGIPRFLGAGFDTATGSPFLATEAFEGVPLGNWLTSESASFASFTEVMRQVFEVMLYVHEQNVAHLDLISSNILVREIRTGDEPSTLEIRVIDFGVADFTDRYSGLRSTGTMMFASPEQTHHQTPDAKMDQFTLGVLIHLVLTGTLPGFHLFTGYTARGMAAMPYPNKLNPRISEELSRVLTQACAYNPAERYPTLRDFSDAWSKAITNMGTAPPPEIRFTLQSNSGTQVTIIALALLTASLILAIIASR